MQTPSQDSHEPHDRDRNGTPSDAASRSRMDDIFLRNSSQALRTRFTTLKGFWQLLDRRMRRDATDAQRAEIAMPLRDEFEHFEHLLLQYLAAAEMQWGRVVHAEGRVDLGELVRDALTDVERRGLLSSRHQLQIHAPEHVIGNGDRHWLRETLEHVIANAVLYSPDGGEIRVTIDRAGDSALVTVQDHGIGVAPEERELIFHPFYRGQRAHDTTPGLGLGLFIAGSVVALHGGTVEVESQLDEGSVFTVRLPLQPTDPVDVPA